jgi:hypothetical protein
MERINSVPEACTGTARTRPVARFAPNRSWDGLELDDAAQGPASGSAHVWRPCMLPQSEEARPCPLAAEALVPGVFLPRLARVLPDPTVTHPSLSPALTGSRTSLPRGNWVPLAERVAVGFYLW